MVNLITEHIDIWTAARTQKINGGRGRGKGSNGQSPHGIKKLRELILELAVRGKLVPQKPNEEPASVLLEKIAQEKKRLIKQGKIKKQKALPKISEDEKPFELPEGWGWGFIPQVVTTDKYSIKRGPFGSSIKKAYFVSTGYKVYEQQHAINDDFSLGEYYIDYEKFNELKAFEVVPNDIIISCSGTVGKVSIAPSWMEPGIINQALLKLSLNQNALTNNYFKILFPAFYMRTETLSELQGTAQKNMVSVDTLKKEPFPLPPLAEQHRIVVKVDELMALCDQLEQQQTDSNATHQILLETLLATLTSAADQGEFAAAWQRIANHFDTLFTTEQSIEQLKQTILQLAVMGKLVPQDRNDEPASVLLEKIAKEKTRLIKEGKVKKQKFLPEISEDEKPFDLPAGWAITRLGNIMNLVSGQHLKPLEYTQTREESMVPYLTGPAEFGDQFPTATRYTYERRALAVDGDILITCKGSGVGKLNTADTEIAISRQLMSIQPIGLNRHYVKLLVQSMNKALREKIVGIAIPGISREDVTQAIVELPPLPEQHRIVAKVDDLMALCDNLKARLNDAQNTQAQLADAIVAQAVA